MTLASSSERRYPAQHGELSVRVRDRELQAPWSRFTPPH
jgi:hypothetical protein